MLKKAVCFRKRVKLHPPSLIPVITVNPRISQKTRRLRRHRSLAGRLRYESACRRGAGRERSRRRIRRSSARRRTHQGKGLTKAGSESGAGSDRMLSRKEHRRHWRMVIKQLIAALDNNVECRFFNQNEPFDTGTRLYM